MRKWTKQEEEIILKMVSLSPDHLREAFHVAASLINRTPESICTRFYNKLNKEQNQERSVATDDQ